MISKQEVKHIAKLARLELTEKEIEKMQKDLSEILNYFDVLRSALKPKADKPISTEVTAWRRDESRKSQISDEIIGAAPDKKDDYIKVKTIL